MNEINYIVGRSSDILDESGPKALLQSGIRYFEFSIINSERYFQEKYHLRKFIQSELHGPVPHAFKILNVNPADIELVSNTEPINKWRDAGKIIEGEWDQSNNRFVDLDIYEAYESRFRDGYDWHQTNFYKRVVSEIESGKTKWGCKSEEEFRERCEKLDALYDSISDNGYIPKKQLLHDHSSGPQTDSHTLTSNTPLAKYDEVAVDIGRNGELLFVDGRNRLAIAKILELPKIPVRVVKRHKKWQNYRMKIVSTNRSVDHPDTQDL